MGAMQRTLTRIRASAASATASVLAGRRSRRRGKPMRGSMAVKPTTTSSGSDDGVRSGANAVHVGEPSTSKTECSSAWARGPVTTIRLRSSVRLTTMTGAAWLLTAAAATATDNAATSSASALGCTQSHRVRGASGATTVAGRGRHRNVTSGEMRPRGCRPRQYKAATP